MIDAFHRQEREHVLGELRVRSLELRLALAHVDHLGMMLRDGKIQPWGAMAAMADLFDGGADAQDQ